MNNPFHYTPSARMLEEQKVLMQRIGVLCQEDSAFAEEVERGKMFGILIAHEQGDAARQTVLAAYSGQICGQFDIHGFIPAVFDYLAPDGYFKTHEREITALNRQLNDVKTSFRRQTLHSALLQLQQSAREDIEACRAAMKEAKAKRDADRASGMADEKKLIAESQFMKAELHRKRQQWKTKIDDVQRQLDAIEADIRRLKLQRQHMSDSLQRWLFSQMLFTDCHGNEKNLLEIWQHYSSSQTGSLHLPSLPPSGSGECCEPKLLHYAFCHSLVPVEMAMFWWGQSPKGEVRRHGYFYPACQGKCRPILQFLLDDYTLYSDSISTRGELKIVYEDDTIMVVDKPSGMLSVPGKGDAESVYTILKGMRSECSELQMVHRLDMDTSGLLVVAKTTEAHKHLQRQFATRITHKTYTALLEHDLTGEGRVDLPLAPDYADRPRQMVDDADGKPAHTLYKCIGGNRILLTPLTGRTHQLRVHCAHHLGLNNPIKGDRLYGHHGQRLCLHATDLSFIHPATGRRMTFHSDPAF